MIILETILIIENFRNDEDWASKGKRGGIIQINTMVSKDLQPRLKVRRERIMMLNLLKTRNWQYILRTLKWLIQGDLTGWEINVYIITFARDHLNGQVRPLDWRLIT